MKLRVGNSCWHAGHVRAATYALEAGLFAQEGLDVEIVHAKVNPKAIESSRPDGERYDEVGTVLRRTCCTIFGMTHHSIRMRAV